MEQDAGVVYIVKNYAGAVFNSDICVEELSGEGICVRKVLVYDDVAIPEKTNRRGLGATPIVIRIAGAAAEEGRSLEQVVAVSEWAMQNARSMGFATNIETLPRSMNAMPLDDHTVELGVGIHGEPGVEQKVDGVEEIVDLLMQPIVDDSPYHAGDRVLLLVSGLGGTLPWSFSSSFTFMNSATAGDCCPALSGGELFDQPGAGRLHGDAAALGRRTASSVGCPGSHPGVALVEWSDGWPKRLHSVNCAVG